MARGQLLSDAASLPSEEAGYKAALCLLRGRVYAAMENHMRACLWYQAALQLDPFCYEAFQVYLLSIRLLARNLGYPMNAGALICNVTPLLVCHLVRHCFICKIISNR